MDVAVSKDMSISISYMLIYEVTYIKYLENLLNTNFNGTNFFARLS